MSEGGTNKYLKFRGGLRAIIGRGDMLTFVTVHGEGQPTSVFRVDTDKWKLEAEALPCGGAALVANDETLFVAGTDGLLYAGPAAGGAISPLKEATPLDPPARALALVGADLLAAASGAQVHLVDLESGAAIQSLELPEEVTAITADPSGLFLVAATAKGHVQVFDREEKKAFLAGEGAKLHQGAVTALCFEPEELRFLSAGTDNKLLLTHARGKLEPEDRAGSAAPSGALRAIVNHPEGELFYTAGADGELKVWTRGQKRPKSFSSKEGVARAVDAALVDVTGRPHLALACEDNSIRLFLLDAAGKVSHRALVIDDALAWARSRFVPLLKVPEAEREQVLDELRGWADGPAVELLAERVRDETSHALKVRATELLGACGHPKATASLEGLLAHEAEKVRLAALAGLRLIEGAASLRPLELALKVNKVDVGTSAVTALGELAREDDLAQVRLVAALNDEPREVRFEALMQLEALDDEASPRAELTALEVSHHADLRGAAILRCFQRGLLTDRAVASALRRHGEDADAQVRQAAFLVSLLSRPTLAAVLRGLDAELHRQLHALETQGEEVDPEAKLPRPKKVAPSELGATDHEPLLEALASRALDTCLRGASALALLRDPRAFGTLLQLSREEDGAARVEVCQALERLGDPRGLQRLRQLLRDGEAQVRDAAFTALTRLLEGSPLEAAEAGLLADHEDVRRRGLKLLGRQLKRSLPKAADAEGYRLLERALNDGASSVRGEAFKTALNLEVFGGGAATLRFTGRSLHADIRREVLTEAMGQVDQDWAWELILELFDDPDPTLRSEAFAFAKKRSKGKALQPLERGLRSEHVDLRLEVVQALSKKVQKETLPLLVEALSDRDPAVRLHAIDALETAEATDDLIAAMGSDQADVKVRAAAACAALGHPKAQEPLLDQLKEPEPELTDLKGPWRERVIQALGGLAALGSMDGVGAVKPLLDHEAREVREAAGRALAWTVPADEPELLRSLLQHSCSRVKLAAALGLAWLGDPLGASLLFPDQPKTASSPSGRKKVARKKVVGASATAPSGAGVEVRAGESLLAAMSLGADDVFLAFLDHTEETIRHRSMRLLMVQEWRENDGVPDRCLAALSSADPRVRLIAARALEHFHDTEAFGAFVVELLSDRGDHEKPWALEAEMVLELAEAIVYGEPRLRVRAAELLELLEEPKRDAFDRAWRRLEARWGQELKTLREEAKARKPAAPAYEPAALELLVFGAYVGLSRQAGGYATHRLRQTALSRIVAMVAAGRAEKEAATPALVQALSDSHQAVRVQAFEALRELGFDPAQLSAEALATKQRDVAVLGLKLLAAEAGKKGGAEVLEGVLGDHDDGLEVEAAKLLAEQIGWVAVHEKSLEGRSEALRRLGVNGLAELYEKETAAQEGLKRALSSRHRALRHQAATWLASKKAPEAFEPLVTMLASDQSKEQWEAINGFRLLGDPRAVEVLLDRIEHDKAGTAQRSALFQAAAAFRAPDRAGRLLGWLPDKKLRAESWRALVTISGYDQWLGVDWEHPDEESWLKGQHPRDDLLLTRLLEAGAELGEVRLLPELMPAAKWAKGDTVGAALSPLAKVGDEGLRRQAIDALGWRLRHRGGAAEPLVEALGHGDPITQLNAAEGLALARRDEGLSVLLAAVETMDDLYARQRAVVALGRLGHERALDLLLRLVGEEGHALQSVAAGAIGHLGRSEKAEKIFEILARLARSDGSAAEEALTGLRWFGGQEAWKLIRERAESGSYSVRVNAAALLRHDDSTESRELLVKLITKSDDYEVVEQAARSYRLLEGADSLEPDYVFVQSEISELEPDTVERLRARGEPARLLEVLPKIHPYNTEEYLLPLISALLGREPLPVDEATAALEAPEERVVEVAARIIGHGGTKKKHGGPLVAATGRLRQDWAKTFAALGEADPGRRREQEGRLEVLSGALRWALWGCGRLKVGEEELISAATLGGEAPEGRPLRQEALTALARGEAGAAGLEALAAAAVGADATLRSIAAAALSRLDRERATALVERSLDDRASLDRLVAGNDDKRVLEALRGAAGKVHLQGVALPHLIARGDEVGLAAALSDKKLPESTRLGALEGLARLAAEAPILKLACDEKEDEALRKAAWRALRRSRRMVKKGEARPGEGGAR